MAYSKIAEANQLQPGEMKSFPLESKTVLLANVDGTFYALDNKCPHMGGNLAGGVLEDTTVTCPRHGAKFDVRTGQNLGSAKIAFVKMNVSDAKAFPVKINGNDILVELG
ncbi:MAG TPA: Rieske 2Fe-2S domain-containing protein [Clostridia bacterium]|nr:Rieske 2Fe-2S domain-containing protein [Clostridia bacterium]